MLANESDTDKARLDYAGAIATYSGRIVYPLNPDPADLDIEDIAHALSNQCRFTGHTKYFYSVAQHSYLASLYVPQKWALWGLLHDASEAYLSDMARPIKKMPEFGEFYLAAEDRLMGAVVERFGLEPILPMPQAVKEVDDLLLGNEILTLMPEHEIYSGWKGTAPLVPGALSYMAPIVAKEMFLARYKELTR
jgi:hypothetical protein